MPQRCTTATLTPYERRALAASCAAPGRGVGRPTKRIMAA
jgi:hypothetical protein